MAAEQLTWIPALRHFSMAVVWTSPVYMKSMQRPVCCDARLQREARRRVCKHTEEGRFRARELPKLIGIKRKRQIHHRSLNTQSHWWAHLIWGTSAAISKGKDPCMEEATVMVPLRLLWVKSRARCQGMTLENRRKAKKKRDSHNSVQSQHTKSPSHGELTLYVDCFAISIFPRISWQLQRHRRCFRWYVPHKSDYCIVGESGYFSYRHF